MQSNHVDSRLRFLFDFIWLAFALDAPHRAFVQHTLNIERCRIYMSSIVVGSCTIEMRDYRLQAVYTNLQKGKIIRQAD